MTGGLAVNLHGITRMTYDIDLLVDLKEENLRKLLNLLREWGFRPRPPVEVEDLFNEKKRMG